MRVVEHKIEDEFVGTGIRHKLFPIWGQILQYDGPKGALGVGAAVYFLLGGP